MTYKSKITLEPHLPSKTQHFCSYQCYIFKCVTFQILLKSVQYWRKDQH